MHANHKTSRRLAFVVDRNSQVPLTDQVEHGIRRSIQSGHCQEGDTLPTLKDMAAELDVSMDVVRTVLRRLVRDRLVTARRRWGITVCPSGIHRWAAHALYLNWGSANSYYQAVLAETLHQGLLEKDILLSHVHLDASEARSGYRTVRTVIRSGPVQLAVVSGFADGVGPLLSDHRIPLIHVVSWDRPTSSFALAGQYVHSSAAIAQSMAHAVACGYRTLMHVRQPEGHDLITAPARAAGLRVVDLVAVPDPELGLPERVERCGLEAVSRFLASKQPLPDVFFFWDDYLARGGLTAMLAHGVQAPGDVGVMSMSNRNLGPVYPIPVTRIEMDPVRDGTTLMALVEEVLEYSSRKRFPPRSVEPRFIPGETTAPRR